MYKLSYFKFVETDGDAMGKLEDMESSNRERLWPQLVKGFKDLSERLKSSRRSHTFKFKEIADHSNQCEQFTLDIFLDSKSSPEYLIHTIGSGSAGMRQREWVHGGRQSMVDESE
ncbi:hypothetical protein Lser_V15G02329 [Lactuca serriola]